VERDIEKERENIGEVCGRVVEKWKEERGNAGDLRGRFASCGFSRETLGSRKLPHFGLNGFRIQIREAKRAAIYSYSSNQAVNVYAKNIMFSLFFFLLK
jgi:hypothetical protein